MGETTNKSICKSQLKKTKLVVHKMDIAFLGQHEDAITIAQSFGFNTKEPKVTTGEKYTAYIYKEEKGETVVYYQYKDRGIVRVITHKLARRQYVTDYITHNHSPVNLDYLELYARIPETHEFAVQNTVLAYADYRGLKIQLIRTPISYIPKVELLRTQKHELAPGLYSTLKLYRDKELKEHPKIEIAIWRKDRLLTKDEITLAGKVITTTLKLSKARSIYNEYDIKQDQIEIDGHDKALHRALFAVSKRLAISTLLQHYFRDKRKAIAGLLHLGYRPSEVARLTGYSKRRIHQIIEELLAQGIIEKTGRGQYRLKLPVPKEQIQHPLPIHVIIREEYHKITIIPVPAKQWDKNMLLQAYTNKGWKPHPAIRQLGIDGILVFYQGDNYLVLKQRLY